ncbi:unnamed protein product [Owenia fusiformis]|uniref:Apple domain-containing protein n=1 Tax=Owenia fusiformis TaxID=6347 RepID=A0A8S4PW55_OWEFU|nr:unnamed protein product [Owenia fusiformis]
MKTFLLLLLTVSFYIAQSESLRKRGYTDVQSFKRELLFIRLIGLERRLEKALSYYNHEDGMCKEDYDTDILDKALLASKDSLLKCAESCTGNPECSAFVYSFTLPQDYCFNMKSLGCTQGKTSKKLTSTSLYRKIPQGNGKQVMLLQKQNN